MPEQWRTDAAGLGVMPASGGGNLVWLPFGAASAREPLELPFTLPEAGDVIVTVAATRAFATHGYLTRQTVTVPTGGGLVPIDVDAAEVALHLPAATPHGVLLQLVRIDDPHWLPLAFAPSGLLLAPGAPRRLWLGAGGYELRDPLDPERRQSFAVPGPAVAVNAELARARGGRP
jgi:hypothetical protein